MPKLTSTFRSATVLPQSGRKLKSHRQVLFKAARIENQALLTKWRQADDEVSESFELFALGSRSTHHEGVGAMKCSFGKLTILTTGLGEHFLFGLGEVTIEWRSKRLHPYLWSKKSLRMLSAVVVFVPQRLGHRSTFPTICVDASAL